MSLGWLSPYRWLLAVFLVAAVVVGVPVLVKRYDARQQEIGYQRAMQEQTAAALAESQAKAKEGFRRLEAQDANQREQDALLARMRRDRDDALAAADRVREQSAEAARQWAGRLADSPTAEDLAAAGDAIRVLTDVRGRLERAGTDLAAHADAARAAGLKCEADYGALKK